MSISNTPWKSTEETYGFYRGARTQSVFSESENGTKYVLADILYMGESGEHEDNTKLIAGSPVLLNASKQMLKEVEGILDLDVFTVNSRVRLQSLYNNLKAATDSCEGVEE